MRRREAIASMIIGALTVANQAQAGVASKVIQEAIEFTGKKFGKEAAAEGIETLASKMTTLAAKHGDEVVATAFKRVGPKAAHVVEEAGEHSGVAVRLLAKHGDEALFLATKKGSLSAVAQFGDEAATALIKHGSVGEKLIVGFGREGAEALAKVTPQNGRRLAMLAADGTLKAELLPVVTRYGDEACEFIWRNKGSLAVGAGLATFLTSPEEFLNGSQKLAGVVVDATVKPLATMPGAVATEAAKHLNWNVIVLFGMSVASFFLYRWTKPLVLLSQASAWWRSKSDTKEVRHG